MGGDLVSLDIVIAFFCQYLGFLANELGGNIHVLVLLSRVHDQVSEIVGDGLLVTEWADDPVPGLQGAA